MVAQLDLNSGVPISFNVSEGTLTWTKIAQLDFVPNDGREVEFFTVWIVGGDYENLYVDQTTGEVFYIGGDLDYETAPNSKSFQLDCACFVQFTDGTFQNEANLAVTAFVTDVDDQPTALDFVASEFTSEISDKKFSIREDVDTTEAVRIARLDITDVDGGLNVVKVIGEDAAYFEIIQDAETGAFWLQLKANVNLDQDKQSPKQSFNISIEYGSDFNVDALGAPPAPEQFELKVQAVNEAAQVAQESPSVFYVDEMADGDGSQPFVHVGSVRAIDPEGDGVSVLTAAHLSSLMASYSVEAASLDNHLFSARPADFRQVNNGQADLYFLSGRREVLDYEARDEYSVFLAFRSSASTNPTTPEKGVSGFYSGQLVTVKVNNVIENDEEMTLQYAENTEMRIGKLKFGNTEGRYSIGEVGSTEPSEKFGVKDGWLILNKNADVNSGDIFNLQIVSSSDTEDAKTVSMKVEINDIELENTTAVISISSISGEVILLPSLGVDKTDDDSLTLVAGQSGNGQFGDWEISGLGYIIYTPHEEVAGQTEILNALQVTDGNGGFESVDVEIHIGIEKTATAEEPNLDGTGGNDQLTGDDSVNRLVGLDGYDTLYGNGGDDFLYGGNGSDGLYGGAGRDVLDGGDGDDTFNGEGGADIIHCGTGDDFIIVRKNQHGDIIKDFNDLEGDTLCIPGYGSNTIYAVRQNGNTYLKSSLADDAETYVTLEDFTKDFTTSSLVEFSLSNIEYVDLPDIV